MKILFNNNFNKLPFTFKIIFFYNNFNTSNFHDENWMKTETKKKIGVENLCGENWEKIG